jgi:hypothetical protein
MALLAVILVPCYLLLNQYWKSMVLLTVVYGALGLAFLRLGRYIRRVMRWLPAEISPWHRSGVQVTTTPQFDVQFSAADAMQNVRNDPHYLQDVLKPRLRQLLVYRLYGMPDVPLDALDTTQLGRVEAAIVDFLQRHEATGLWARYCRRRQRVQDVLAVLRHLEAL